MDISDCVRCTFGDSIGLVVWAGEWKGIKGCRVRSDMTLLDTIPLDISGAERIADYEARPDVAWSGESFLVAWHDWEKLYACIVAPDGQVLDRILVTSLPYRITCASAVAFDGDNFLVTWTQQESYDSWKAMFTRISPDGRLLDSVPRRVTPNRGEQYQIDVAFGGGRCLAVWQYYEPTDYRQTIYGSFIQPDGSVPDSVGFPIWKTGDPDAPAVSFDGQNFVVAWCEGGESLRLTRVSPGGTVLDTTGVLIAKGLMSRHDLVSVAETTLVVWSDGWSEGHEDSILVHGVRIDGTGAVLDSMPLSVSPPAQGTSRDLAPDYATAMAAGGRFAVVWSHPFPDPHSECRNVVYRRMLPSGQFLDSSFVILSYAPSKQKDMDVASDSEDFLAVWTEHRLTPTEYTKTVRGSRFTPGGQVLDPAGFDVSSFGSHPAVGYGHGCYLVCWLKPLDSVNYVYGMRVSREGRLLDTVPFAVCTQSYKALCPEVAYVGGVFLVVWFVYPGHELYGARVMPDGRVLDTVPLPLWIRHRGVNPELGTDGHDFLLVRRDYPYSYMRALRIDKEGQILDTVEILLGKGGGHSSHPWVAYGDSLYMVMDEMEGSAWRVTRDGVVLDSMALPNGGGRYSLCFDGTNFLATSVVQFPVDNGTGLEGQRISSDGRLLDSVPFRITDLQSSVVYHADLKTAAAVTAGGQGYAAAVFRSAEHTGYVSDRARAVVFPALAGIESQPSAAFSDFDSIVSSVVKGRLLLRGRQRAALLDVSGRRVLDLHAGDNDVSQLGAGVYFVYGTDGARPRRVVVVR